MSGKRIQGRMIAVVTLLVLGCALCVAVYGIVIPKMEEEREAKIVRQQHPLTHDLQEVLKYRHPYMGNAGNLSNLFYHLPLQKWKTMLQLHSDHLIADIHYSPSMLEEDRELLQQSLIYNATAAFALIDNLQTLRFVIGDETITIERVHVERWYGVKASTLLELSRWQAEVQEKLNDPEYVEACLQDWSVDEILDVIFSREEM